MNASYPILFLSYARADWKPAERLKADLEKSGHRCWMDTADLKGGRDWLDAIEQAISCCYAFVSLISPAANRSKYVRAEFLHAEHLKKTVVPLLLEGEPPWYMANRLDAREFWPDPHWWRRSGWEEAVVLLAGLYHRDCTLIIEWLRDTQPEVAADCILRSGARTTEATLRAAGESWLSQLEDPAIQEPSGRAALGRALGRVRLNGRMLDKRPGVGLDPDSLPDIDWVAIPAGEFIYQDGERRPLDAFHIARYPVTNEPFRAFIEAPDGHDNKQWWAGFEDEFRAPTAPIWDEGNCPRETVDWYQALAFCRWLSARRGYEIRLPTEVEWERAARYTDGRDYPWEGGFDRHKANVSNDLGRTSPVGIYPLGRSREGVDDLAGNVWEWCLNKYDKPEVIQADTSGDWRAVRGGSWIDNPEDARAAIRYWLHPNGRRYDLGFRVLCAAPMRSEH